MKRGAADFDRSLLARAAFFWHFNACLITQIRKRERTRVILGCGQKVVEPARRNDSAAMRTRTRTHINDVVRRINSVFVVLHHENGVAEVFEREQGRNQAIVVALVESDSWLIEHVERTHEPGTKL